MAAPFRTPSPPKITAPDHAGNRRPNAVYWTDPPLKIGKLASAWSNQTDQGFETDRSPRAAVILAVIFVPVLALLTVGMNDWLGPLGVVGFLVFVAGFIAFAYVENKSRPWCNYLGEEGFSEHKITWRRTEHDVVLFEAIAGMWLTRTEHYTNGVYQHTTEVYDWRNKAGQTLLKRSATLHERGMAAAGARFGSGGSRIRNPSREWMSAVADAWQLRRSKQALEELEDSGAAVFPTQRGRYLAIRRGSIETNISGKTMTITAADVLKSKLEAGVVTLKTRNGKLRFSVSDIADHTIAFVLAEEVAGLPLLGD